MSRRRVVSGNLHLLALQAVLLQLAGHQVAPGDLQFFRGGVAGQADHLQTIAQRGMNRDRANWPW